MDIHSKSRKLRDLVEPIAASVYFSGDAFKLYQDLGVSFLPGYFCSRSACLGRLNGNVVAAIFGTFNPAVVALAVEEGWSHTTPEKLLQARLEGAVSNLKRLLDDQLPPGVQKATEILRKGTEAARIEGHPLFAGLKSLPWPDDPLGALWRASDLVREHRGDSHVCAWTLQRLSGIEIELLSNAWRGAPIRGHHTVTRGWSEEQIGDGINSLHSRGLVEGEQLTQKGNDLRSEIEAVTDEGEADILLAISDQLDDLFDILEPISAKVIEKGGDPLFGAIS
ncbi:MAG: hypothetical protein M1483_04520 [Actinobacteria bacterium]|nr:hypothetical protein [Actinomycetota bacterium]MCL6104876.1 hypothetical protein [Actinomycetota bacterium]